MALLSLPGFPNCSEKDSLSSFLLFIFLFLSNASQSLNRLSPTLWASSLFLWVPPLPLWAAYLPMAVCWLPFHTRQTNSKGVAASLPLVPLSWLLAYAVVFLLDYNKLFSSFLLKFLHWLDQDYKVGTWMSLVPLGTPGRAPQIRDKNFKEATFLVNIWEIPSKTQRHIHRVLWIDE